VTRGGFVQVDYRRARPQERFDRARALDPVLVLGFIQRPRRRVGCLAGHPWRRRPARIVLDHWSRKWTPRVAQGAAPGLQVLRQEAAGGGVRAGNRMNPETLAQYTKKTVLTVTRQLYYSEAQSKAWIWCFCSTACRWSRRN
jgi:hypothetical protein